MDRDSDFGSKGCGPDKNRQCLKNDGAVDMESGPIARVAVTRASVPDAKGLALVCPCGGEACADKAWCGKDGLGTIRARGCEERVIERSDMKDEDWARDGAMAKKRMPFERGVFQLPEQAALHRPGEGSVPGRGLRDGAQLQEACRAWRRADSDSLNGFRGRSLSGIRRKRRKRTKIGGKSQNFTKI